MSNKRDSDGVFKSDLIVILVGPLKERFTAHKAILTQADWFQGCLEGCFPEKERKEIVLPEDDPVVFEKLLQYLYLGWIAPQKFTSSEREKFETKHMVLLAKVYVAADKYCMEDCQNHLMNHFWDFHSPSKSRIPCPQAIAELNTVTESPLRKYLLEQLAASLLCGEKNGSSVLLKEKAVMDMVRGGGDDAGDIFRACLDFSWYQASGKDETTSKRCDFHTHKVTKKCGETK